MTLDDESFQDQEPIPRQTWPTWEGFPPLTGPTILDLGPKLFTPTPSTVLKLQASDGEAAMTALGRSILGPVVPNVECIVWIPEPKPARGGIVISRQPGKPLVEVWPSLSPSQRERIKSELCDMILRMRKPRFSYYGRPSGQPYVLMAVYRKKSHDFCKTRSEWDDSRIQALRSPSPVDKTYIDADRLASLEKIQRNTIGPAGWDRPVLTHGDLSDRNILIDPETLVVTGLIDWELANIMPAYFEFVNARLCGGHSPEWREELLDIMKMVLRRECDTTSGDNKSGELLYEETMAAWKEIVKAERPAQYYTDDCYWTFEGGKPPVHGPAL